MGSPHKGQPEGRWQGGRWFQIQESKKTIGGGKHEAEIKKSEMRTGGANEKWDCEKGQYGM